jgi:hypothetical protein
VTEQPINKSGKGGTNFFEKVLHDHFIVSLYYFNCQLILNTNVFCMLIVKEKGTYLKFVMSKTKGQTFRYSFGTKPKRIIIVPWLGSPSCSLSPCSK